MSFSLLPGKKISALTEITADRLNALDIRLLMLDFDNTIVPYTTDIPTAEMEQWIRDILSLDIRICVVSNSRNDRVVRFCKNYGLDCITRAKKPGTRGIRECLNRYGIPANQAALVGDQIYTDTLGANRAGVLPILVNAIDNHNFWLKARHVLEIPFILIAGERSL